MNRIKNLTITLGVGVVCMGTAIAMPTDAKTELKFGQANVNLTPVKNTLIVTLGLAFTSSCLMGIKLIDQMEDLEKAEQEQRQLQLEADQRRQVMAANAQLQAEESYHRAIAERSVKAALMDKLRQEVPANAQAVAALPQHPMASSQHTGQILPTQLSLDPPGFNTDEHTNATQAGNFAEKLGLNPKCFMILGVPGSGKGMVVSHASRILKQSKPHLQIIGIDPKDDPKEAGYWEAGFDHAFRKNAERMENHDFLKWVKGCVEYFKKLPDGKLLVFDEITATFNRWSRLDNESFESFMVDYCTSVSSSGDSRENYVWLVGQIPHASALGVDGGIRSIYKPVAIVSKFDKRATDTFLGTKFIPKTPGGNKAVYEVMERSPRGRAIYDYTEDRWVPMQEMKNFSGYDRDSRTQIS
ncbi:MAG: hypothetical protein AAFY17_13275 [Cyanobacteria bacterium J06642_11]